MSVSYSDSDSDSESDEILPRNKAVVKRINRLIEEALDNDEKYVCLKYNLPESVKEKVKKAGYVIREGYYIYNKNREGAEPWECLSYKYDRYLDEYKYSTIIYLFSEGSNESDDKGWCEMCKMYNSCFCD